MRPLALASLALALGQTVSESTSNSLIPTGLASSEQDPEIGGATIISEGTNVASDTEISWTFPNENAEFRVYLPKDTLVITIDSSNGFSADSFIILQEILNLSKEEMIPFEYVQIPVGGEFSNTTLKGAVFHFSSEYKYIA